MKKWLIPYYLVFSILLGGYFQLHARTYGELVRSLNVSSLEVLDETPTANQHNHHHQAFVYTNSSSALFFIKTLFETIDTESDEEDENEKSTSKQNNLSAKKLINLNFNSYIASLFYLKSSELQCDSVFEKKVPVSAGFASFSSDERLYVIFENIRI